jgi:hypothetical protein
MLFVRLRRAFVPAEVESTFECGLCGHDFVPGSVLADAVSDPEDRSDMGALCPTCVEYLGKRNPEGFPSIEDLKDAQRRYPEPVWASGAEVERLFDEDEAAHERAYKAAWIAPAVSR